jgi:hypothetical protein
MKSPKRHLRPLVSTPGINQTQIMKKLGCSHQSTEAGPGLGRRWTNVEVEALMIVIEKSMLVPRSIHRTTCNQVNAKAP